MFTFLALTLVHYLLLNTECLKSLIVFSFFFLCVYYTKSSFCIQQIFKGQILSNSEKN